MLTTAGGATLEAATWIDLFEPSDADAAMVRAATGLRVPRRSELLEIEQSSRLQREDRALYMSAPSLVPAPAAPHPSARPGGGPAPVGYVLTSERLLTVRFSHLPAFDARLATASAGTATGHFVGLLETVVDHLADVLEQQAALLDEVQAGVFAPVAGPSRPANADRRLRGVLAGIGAIGGTLGRLRDALLGLGRIVPYVVANAAWLDADARARLLSLRDDIASLSDYDARLSDKVQFLLDATLGFINIEQNNIIKMLTIVSIVGIPPTFVASLYGMNFHDIPELSWSFGYWYALGLMAVTAIAPLLWFRHRGWL